MLAPQLLLLLAFLVSAAANVQLASPNCAAEFLGPFVLATTAAFGDASRRLLQQRVGVKPGKRFSVTANVALLAALPFVHDPVRRWAVAIAGAALWLIGASRSARAMADALGVDVFAIRPKEKQ